MLAPFFRFISGIDRPANSSTFCLDMVAPDRFYLFIGLSLFLIWLLVICSYASTFFHFVYWQRRASPPVESLCLDMVWPARLYFFMGSSLFIIWLLVICSYARPLFSCYFLALMGQPTQQLFALTWFGLPGYINLWVLDHVLA